MNLARKRLAIRHRGEFNMGPIFDYSGMPKVLRTAQNPPFAERAHIVSSDATGKLTGTTAPRMIDFDKVMQQLNESTRSNTPAPTIQL